MPHPFAVSCEWVGSSKSVRASRERLLHAMVRAPPRASAPCNGASLPRASAPRSGLLHAMVRATSERLPHAMVRASRERLLHAIVRASRERLPHAVVCSMQWCEPHASVCSMQWCEPHAGVCRTAGAAGGSSSRGANRAPIRKITAETTRKISVAPSARRRLLWSEMAPITVGANVSPKQ